MEKVKRWIVAADRLSFPCAMALRAKIGPIDVIPPELDAARAAVRYLLSQSVMAGHQSVPPLMSRPVAATGGGVLCVISPGSAVYSRRAGADSLTAAAGDLSLSGDIRQRL